MKISCKKHPNYKAIYFPTADCGACKVLYFLKHVGRALEVDLPDNTTLKFKVEEES